MKIRFNKFFNAVTFNNKDKQYIDYFGIAFISNTTDLVEIVADEKFAFITLGGLIGSPIKKLYKLDLKDKMTRDEFYKEFRKQIKMTKIQLDLLMEI